MAGQQQKNFDRKKYDGFENYSVFLKTVKETLRRENQGSNKDESSFCTFRELLDHLQNSNNIDIFVFKVA